MDDCQGYDDHQGYDGAGCDESALADVAAYALGVLDPGDAARVERHLAGCARCADELDALLPTTGALTGVDPADLPELDRPVLLDRLTAAVTADRVRARQRRWRATALAGAVVAAAALAGLVTGAQLVGPTLAGQPGRAPGTPVPPAGPQFSPAGVDGPDLADGERFTVTDPDTRVRADVVLAGHDYGSHLSVTLRGLTGPREYQLLLVRPGGTAERAATWRVPGPGTGSSPAPVRVAATTAIGGDHLAALQVQALTPGGPATLVTVPL